METVDELLEEYSIQQINQMVKLNNRGYDVSYLPPKVLTVEKLRLFLSFIEDIIFSLNNCLMYKFKLVSFFEIKPSIKLIKKILVFIRSLIFIESTSKFTSSGILKSKAFSNSSIVLFKI